MNVQGYQKLTLLDFPGKLACTVFTGGCNFRCPFCHNALLVTEENSDNIAEDEFFSFLKKRQGILEGVCISGGEPTLQPDLRDVVLLYYILGYNNEEVAIICKCAERTVIRRKEKALDRLREELRAAYE